MHRYRLTLSIFAQGNGNLYGTHPWFWYILAGLPAIAGILIPLFLFEVMECLRNKMGQQQNWFNHPRDVLLVITVAYVSFHSISGHKEFRFILPILPLVCILAGNTMHTYYTCETTGTPMRERRKLVLLSILILFNYPHMIFLCTSHQGAPIQVNKAIASYIAETVEISGRETSQLPLEPISIHYLMGCHSTPLYSHLHIQFNGTTNFDSVPIDAWHLDCSPKCRSDESILCESNRFSSDPLSFISEEYGIRVDTCSHSKEEICESNIFVPLKLGGKRTLPHLLAIFEEDLQKADNNLITSLLESIGMTEMQKFPNAVKSFSLASDRHKSDGMTSLVRLPLGFKFKVDYHHIILFKAS
jgi:hypothetical protein